MLVGRDAETFFTALPPTKLRSGSGAAKDLQQRMDLLMGPKHPPQLPMGHATAVVGASESDGGGAGCGMLLDCVVCAICWDGVSAMATYRIVDTALRADMS